MQVADPEPASVEYVLSTYPLAHETFVTGEIRAMASLIPAVSVTGMMRSPQADIRPGGVPESVQVRWIPRPLSVRFWMGTMRGLVAQRPGVGPGFGMASGLSPRQILRWTSLLAGARAHAFLQRPARPGGHHLHAHFAARGAVGANVMSRAWGVPYSMTVHAYDLFLPNPRLPALTLGAALVVAISEYDRQELLRLVPAADPERITVIHAGVPVDELRAGGPGPQRLARERPLVVSVGRLVPKKGMDVLVRAVALLARDGIPVSCEIIGDGGERPRLEALIRELGVEALVTLRGELLPAEARFRIAEADLFALACVRAPNGDMDGIPVALMEGMAVGTPVVSTILSGIPELVTDDENGLLVEPGDPTYLAAAIRRLLDDRPFAHGLAVSAARTIADRFDQDANARLLLASITQARAAGPPGRLSPTGRP